MFNRYMVNIINHLYEEQPLVDKKTQEILHCNDDRVLELLGLQVVTAANGKWELPPGVLGLLTLAEQSLRKFPPEDWLFGSPLRDPLAKPRPKPACFVAMPYSTKWFSDVQNRIKQAVEATDCEFKLALDISAPGAIMQQVWMEIRSADIILADLTGLNANVMYEVGIAHALGKEVILITQNEAEIPFNLRGLRRVPYNLADLSALGNELIKSLSAVSAQLALLKG